MILIAHRGNVNGPSTAENSPSYIMSALEQGFDAEIDVRFVDGEFWLGHDGPMYLTTAEFLRQPGLWCHAKNFDALNMLRVIGVEHYFCHDIDAYTLTSSGYVWTYPGWQLGAFSIAVMPEIVNADINSIDKSIYGICSDYVSLYEEASDF